MSAQDQERSFASLPPVRNCPSASPIRAALWTPIPDREDRRQATTTRLLLLSAAEPQRQPRQRAGLDVSLPSCCRFLRAPGDRQGVDEIVQGATVMVQCRPMRRFAGGRSHSHARTPVQTSLSHIQSPTVCRRPGRPGHFAWATFNRYVGGRFTENSHSVDAVRGARLRYIACPAVRLELVGDSILWKGSAP